MNTPLLTLSNTSPRRGFTLIELLGVMLLIAMLLTITMVASTIVLKNARAKKIEMTKTTLEGSIMQFYNDYKYWPGSNLSQANEHGNTMISKKRQQQVKRGNVWVWEDSNEDIWEDGGYTVDGNANAKVFNDLLFNDRNIKYLDESALSRWMGKDGLVSLAKPSVRDSRSAPLAFRDTDKKAKAFKVVIYPIDKKVSVQSGQELR